MRSGRTAEGGFTLLELLIALVILPLIVGGVATAVIAELDNTSQNDANGTYTRLINSHDTQITSAYFVRDVQSATTVSTLTTSSLCGTPTEPQLLGLGWTVNGTPVTVSYGVSTTTPLTLVRRYCQGGTTQTDSTLSHGMFPTSLSSVTVTNSSCSQGSACIEDASGKTYMDVTVNCSSGGTICADNGSVPVVMTATGGGGIASVTISVLENQATSYQYTLTGVPRAASTVSQGNQNSNPPQATLISNGPVDVGSCQGISYGTTAINDPSGVALSVNSHSGSFSVPTVYTSGGTVSGVTPVPSFYTGAPVRSPYDSLAEPPAAETVTALNGQTMAVSSPSSITSVTLASLPLDIAAGQDMVVTEGSQTLYLPVTSAHSASTTSVTVQVTSTPANGTYIPGKAAAYPAYVELDADPTKDPGLDLTQVLPPGIYLWPNGISYSGNKDIRGTAGVLFYVTGGNVSLGGNNQTTLVPLTTDWESTPATTVAAINKGTSSVSSGTSISSLTLSSVPTEIFPGDIVKVSNSAGDTLSVTAATGSYVSASPATIAVKATAANATYAPGPTTTAIDQPQPEVVLWISRTDTPTPTLDLGGTSGTVAIEGAVYAPTAKTTVHGGGGANSGASVSATSLVVGDLTCKGGGQGIDIVAGSSGAKAATVTSGSASPASVLAGANVTDDVSVTGLNGSAPGGYAWAYLCGPFPTEPISAPVCTDSGSSVVATGTNSVALAAGATPGTSVATVSYTAPAAPGWYCFATYYSATQSSDAADATGFSHSSDTTADGCFQVTAPVITVDIVQPAKGSCYYSRNASTGCNLSTPNSIGGTASSTGSGSLTVTLTIQGPDRSGKYWDGGKYSGKTSTVTASLNGANWSYSFPTPASSNGLVSDGTGMYTITATATDGATSSTTSSNFMWNG